MRRMILLPLLAVLLLIGTAGAVTVRHDAPSGVAAMAVLRVKAETVWNEGETTVYYMLTTDGRVKAQLWKDNRAEAEDWKSTEIDWPVPFSSIVEWVPGSMYPGIAEIELAAGIIVTAEGAVWRAAPDFEKSWDSAVVFKGIRWEEMKSD